MDEMYDKKFSEYGLTPPLPNNPTVTMAYVPFQSYINKLYIPSEALEAGTIFPVLDKPFLGRRVGK